MKKFQERRDSIRIKRIVTVRHRLYKHRSHKAESIWQTSMSKNMSLSGLYFISALRYKVGDIVELQVVMSGEFNIFNGFAKVLRIRRNKGGYYEVAVKYVDLKPKRSA